MNGRKVGTLSANRAESCDFPASGVPLGPSVRRPSRGVWVQLLRFAAAIMSRRRIGRSPCHRRMSKARGAPGFLHRADYDTASIFLMESMFVSEPRRQVWPKCEARVCDGGGFLCESRFCMHW